MRIISTALLAALLMGCSSRTEVPAATTSLIMHDKSGKWQPHEIPGPEAKLLEGIVAAHPDEEFAEGLPLEASYMVEIEGTRYALEENEIIFLGARTKRWKSEGIQRKVLEAVEKR